MAARDTTCTGAHHHCSVIKLLESLEHQITVSLHLNNVGKPALQNVLCQILLVLKR